MIEVIQSLWTRNSHDLDSIKGSWCSLEASLACWALNNIRLNKYYDVKIYGDSFSYEILVNRLGLEYGEFINYFDDYDYPFDQRLWCFNKIHIYSIQERPFMHIDGDVFLFKQLPDQLVSSPLFGQNLEVNLPNYEKCLVEIENEFPEIDSNYFLRIANEPILASNAGVMGGWHLDSFKKLRKIAHKFLSDNIDYIDNVSTGYLNIMSEQLPINKIAAENSVEISYLLDPASKDSFPNINEFHNVYEGAGYVHVMGAKKDLITCETILCQLAFESKGHFFKIQHLVYGSKDSFFLALRSRLKQMSFQDFGVQGVSRLEKEGTHQMSEDHTSDMSMFISTVVGYATLIIDSFLEKKDDEVLIFLEKGPKGVKAIKYNFVDLTLTLDDLFSVVESKWIWVDQSSFVNIDFDLQVEANRNQAEGQYYFIMAFCPLHSKFVVKLCDALDLFVISVLSRGEMSINNIVSGVLQTAEATLGFSKHEALSNEKIVERLRLYALYRWVNCQ